MNEEEAKEIIDNMSEQELNDFLFFALQEVEKENQKLKTELEKKDRQLEERTNRIRNLEKECQSNFDNMMDTIQDNSKKDKIIDEIQKEVRVHIGFENRLKRDNKEPDLFNQGRFYVANNINNIMKGK